MAQTYHKQIYHCRKNSHHEHIRLALMFQQLRRHVVALMLVRNELTCEICVDIITDIDEWLTSDKTEQEIIDFISQVQYR